MNELKALTQDKTQLHKIMGDYIPDLETLLHLCELPQQANHVTDISPHWHTGIPGKKWQQIQAFSQGITKQTPILEWCAGKGHLGRYLALIGHPRVTSLEWQQTLCDAGEQVAKKSGLKHDFQHQDVFAADTERYLHPEQTAVALHACGDLHQRLITIGCEKQLGALYISPCCYHLIEAEQYQPLSAEGKRQDLQLSKADLSMCLRQTVTGGAKVKRQRQQELLWRLSFDCLQRQLRKQDTYLALPTIPRQLLNGSFADFIYWCCQQKHLATPDLAQIEAAQEQGTQRLRANLHMELVQHCFQRPIEVWLVLDKALYLQQQGYQVDISEFCPATLTPRNLKISALRC